MTEDVKSNEDDSENNDFIDQYGTDGVAMEGDYAFDNT
jgi:hypothetical protein